MNVPDSPPPGDVLEEFKAAHAALFSPLLSTDLEHPVEPEDLKCSVEEITSGFMEKAKALQVHFLQQRLRLATLRPELCEAETLEEMKAKLQRKNELLDQTSARVEEWKQRLSFLEESHTPTPAPPAFPSGPPSSGPHLPRLPQVSPSTSVPSPLHPQQMGVPHQMDPRPPHMAPPSPHLQHPQTMPQPTRGPEK